jgi:hypothetical protein
MIIWKNLGMDSGAPTFNFPKDLTAYEVDAYSYGDNQLWCASITKHGFPVARDHFLTGEEAYEFIEVVVNMLDLKYPNAVCSNFSFLTKQE